MRIYIKPAHSGHLCLIQKCEYNGTTITNSKTKAKYQQTLSLLLIPDLLAVVQYLFDLLSKQEVIAAVLHPWPHIPATSVSFRIFLEISKPYYKPTE